MARLSNACVKNANICCHYLANAWKMFSDICKVQIAFDQFISLAFIPFVHYVTKIDKVMKARTRNHNIQDANKAESR